jgi:hypothetical protein
MRSHTKIVKLSLCKTYMDPFTSYYKEIIRFILEFSLASNSLSRFIVQLRPAEKKNPHRGGLKGEARCRVAERVSEEFTQAGQVGSKTSKLGWLEPQALRQTYVQDSNVCRRSRVGGRNHYGRFTCPCTQPPASSRVANT